MPTSLPGSDPDSQSESDGPGSENSDSSSSDFEIQAVTTADGIRTEATAEEEATSTEDKQFENELTPVKANQAAPNENFLNMLGLNVYSGLSSSDENEAEKPIQTPASKPFSRHNGRPRKRVRFADDLPSKKQRYEPANGRINGPASSRLPSRMVGEEEKDEDTTPMELEEFEAAVADAVRVTDDIMADLADADDAREEVKQQELEDRVKQLREAVMRTKTRAMFHDYKEGDSSEEESNEESESSTE